MEFPLLRTIRHRFAVIATIGVIWSFGTVASREIDMLGADGLAPALGSVIAEHWWVAFPLTVTLAGAFAAIYGAALLCGTFVEQIVRHFAEGEVEGARPDISFSAAFRDSPMKLGLSGMVASYAGPQLYALLVTLAA